MQRNGQKPRVLYGVSLFPILLRNIMQRKRSWTKSVIITCERAIICPALWEVNAINTVQRNRSRTITCVIWRVPLCPVLLRRMRRIDNEISTVYGVPLSPKYQNTRQYYMVSAITCTGILERLLYANAIKSGRESRRKPRALTLAGTFFIERNVRL